jgi:malonate transporter MadL subunit
VDGLIFKLDADFHALSAESGVGACGHASILPIERKICCRLREGKRHASRHCFALSHLLAGEGAMIILGVALLATCTLIGVFVGDLLGIAVGVKANVGGIGIAMILLIAARFWLSRNGRLSRGVKFGVEFWGGMYIPIVVAMAAQQNVVAALRGGPMVIIAAVGSVVLCFGAVALLSRIGRRDDGSAEVEHGGSVIEGDVVADDRPHAAATSAVSPSKG